MTKKAKRQAPKKTMRRQPSRLQREKRFERILIWSVIVLGLLVVGVLGYGIVFEKLIKAREPVAFVGDTPITTADFQARVGYERMLMNYEVQSLFQQLQFIDPEDPNADFYLQYIQSQISDLQSQLSPENAGGIGEQVLEQMIQEELVRREAKRRGITITPEEVQQEIELEFGYDRSLATLPTLPAVTAPLTTTESLTSTPEVTPFPTSTPMTAEGFRENYSDLLKRLRTVGMSEHQFRSLFEAQLFSEKLLDQMTEEVPAMADQVELQRLMVDSEERASELAARLDAGEDFQTLADELDEEETGGGYSFVPSWFPVDTLEQDLGADLADAVLSLEVGEHSQPVPNADGTQYIVVEVLSREVRELDEWSRRQRATEALQEWLEGQQVLVERTEYDPDIVPTEP
jgi:parvulin-like peptidyl-prolyl isomerase